MHFEMQLICKGNGLNVAKVIPESGIKFGSYEVPSRYNLTLGRFSDETRLPRELSQRSKAITTQLVFNRCHSSSLAA